MQTPQDRIVEQLESDAERLTLERDELKDELKILKKMLEDATEEKRKESAHEKYVSRDDQAFSIPYLDLKKAL